MEHELKKIKKLYGEKMMQMCRKVFSTILEEEGKLINILVENFNPSHDLYDDIMNHGMFESFKTYIYGLLNFDYKYIEVNESPKQLLAKAGYDLYECQTEKDIQSFKKYYVPEEELCTFYSNRSNSCRVFFAVKKNVIDIKRQNFPNPQRQDEYGTSVISIQFTKDGTNTLSIKNRYNHKVINPDATFGNNLDNIIPGLTTSFEKYYGIAQKNKKTEFGLPGYVRANDGKHYKYNYEIGNIYYCPNNIIIDNFEVKKYEKEKYIILDYFVLDLVNKTIQTYDNKIKDCFINILSYIERIDIENKSETKKINIILKNGEESSIEIDNFNRIIKYKNDNIKKIYDNFLRFNLTLKEIELPKLSFLGYDFLYTNNSIKVLMLPKLRQVGSNFLISNSTLEEVDLPNLESIEHDFLSSAHKLEKIDFPKLRQVGDYFLCPELIATKVNLPNLEQYGEDFFLQDSILSAKNEKITNSSKKTNH